MNTSRYLLKSNGTQIDADDLNSAIPYPSGSYNFFTANNGAITTAFHNPTHLRFYNINVRSECSIDRFAGFVSANATPTAGAKVGVIICQLINNTTMQVYANVGEISATTIGSTTSVQAVNITPINLPIGQYWVGVSHSNATQISLGATSTQNLFNYISTYDDNFTPAAIYESNTAYTYPRTIGSNITVANTTAYNNVSLIKFRIQ